VSNLLGSKYTDRHNIHSHAGSYVVAGTGSTKQADGHIWRCNKRNRPGYYITLTLERSDEKHQETALLHHTICSSTEKTLEHWSIKPPAGYSSAWNVSPRLARLSSTGWLASEKRCGDGNPCADVRLLTFLVGESDLAGSVGPVREESRFFGDGVPSSLPISPSVGSPAQ
jgi:hypothetical protein